MTNTVTHTRNTTFIDPLIPITSTVRFSRIIDHQIAQHDRPIPKINIAYSLEIQEQATVNPSKFGVNTLTSRRGRQQIPIDKPGHTPRDSTPAVSFLAAYPTPAE